MRLKKREIIILSVALIAGLIVGYSIGIYQAFQICLDLANKLLHVSIDPASFKELLEHYPAIKMMNFTI